VPVKNLLFFPFRLLAGRTDRSPVGSGHENVDRYYIFSVSWTTVC